MITLTPAEALVADQAAYWARVCGDETYGLRRLVDTYMEVINRRKDYDWEVPQSIIDRAEIARRMLNTRTAPIGLWQIMS